MRKFSTPCVDENVGKGVKSGVDVRTGSGVKGIEVTVCVGATIVSDGNGLEVDVTPGIVVDGVRFDEQPAKNTNRIIT